MTRRANYAAVAWAVVLAITLAACGSDSTPTGEPTTTANITFKTDPVASVWIDGENKGTTPVVIAVDAGQREVVLKAEGFEDMQETITVEAGKDLTVDTGLMLAGTDVADYKRLLATLGIEHEPYGEAPKAHRGLGDTPVMLYWPQGTMRRQSLATYRIEVTPDYEDDGYVVFKKGRKELHREKFEAEDLVTERAIPASVMEAMKAGGNYSWGIYYDSKRKKPAVAKFKVASRSKERSFERRVKKVERRKSYQRLDPLMRSMAKVDLLRNHRYYSEALSESLSVVNTWPDTQMPYKSIAFCLERMKLKDTALYDVIGQSLRGSGRFSPKKAGLAGGTDLGHRKGGQTQGIPTPLLAPRVRDRKAAGPGGMGVMPTPDAQKRKPGPIEPDATGNGVTPDAGTDSGRTDSGPTDEPGVDTRDPRDEARQEEIEQLERELELAQSILEEQQALGEAAETAAADAQEARLALHDTQEALNGAQQALETLEKLEAATPGSVPADDMQAARDAVTAADAAATAAREAHDRALAASEERKQELERSTEATRRNPPDQEVRRLQRELEALKSEPDRTGGQGSADPGKTDTSGGKEPLRPEPPARDFRAEIDFAQNHLESQTQWLDEATETANQALGAVDSANAALDAKIASGGTPAEIAALELALRQAQDEEARAVMERERARGAVETASQIIEELRKQESGLPDKKVEK